MVASVVHHDHVNATLGTTPSEVLLGYRPILHPDQEVETNNQAVEQHLETMAQRRAQAIAAINKTANKSPVPIERFKVGDRVWLEASHLKLPYHTPKLAPPTSRAVPCQQSDLSSGLSACAFPCRGEYTMFSTHPSYYPIRKQLPMAPNFERPPPDLIEDVEEYEVEAIHQSSTLRASAPTPVSNKMERLSIVRQHMGTGRERARRGLGKGISPTSSPPLG